jgi:hypothetical protein
MGKIITETEKATDVVAEKAATLAIRVETNSKDEWKADVFEADLSSMKLDDLNDIFDSCCLSNTAQCIIRNWHSLVELPPNVTDWVRNPENDDQIDAIQAPTFTPAAYKKQFAVMDLENRKINADKDGNFSVLEVTGKRWDAGKGELVDTKGWSSAGQTMFNAKQKSNVYNFVIRAVASLGYEVQYADNIKEAVKAGYRTIQQRRTAKQFVHTMVKPNESKSKTKMIGGKTVTEEQANYAAAEYIKQNPSAFSEEKKQD